MRIIDAHNHPDWHGYNLEKFLANMAQHGIEKTWLFSWECPARRVRSHVQQRVPDRSTGLSNSILPLPRVQTARARQVRARLRARPAAARRHRPVGGRHRHPRRAALRRAEAAHDVRRPGRVAHVSLLRGEEAAGHRPHRLRVRHRPQISAAQLVVRRRHRAVRARGAGVPRDDLHRPRAGLLGAHLRRRPVRAGDCIPPGRCCRAAS